MPNQQPTRTDSHNKVYDVIDGEIEYAVKTHPQSPPLLLTEYIALIDQFAVKLATPFSAESPAEPAPVLTVEEEVARARKALGVIREIAALSVRAMAAYGSVPRENHVPASAGITGTIDIQATPDKLRQAPAKQAVADALVHTGPAPVIQGSAASLSPTPAPAPAEHHEHPLTDQERENLDHQH